MITFNLRAIYNWAVQNNMFFNSQKFHSICYIFTRKTSLFTKSLVSFCDYEGLTCVNLISNAQQFTYVSDMNGSKSLIDHFIISDNLLNYANTSDARDDIDNHSDHLPITMYLHISIPIKKIASCNYCSYLNLNGFVNEMLQKYQYELDQHLGSIPVSEFMCDHMHDNNKYQIQLLHDHLIHSCMLAAERTIPFTKPHAKRNRNKAGWNEHVIKEFDHALHRHRLYLQNG